MNLSFTCAVLKLWFDLLRVRGLEAVFVYTGIC